MPGSRVRGGCAARARASVRTRARLPQTEGQIPPLHSPAMSNPAPVENLRGQSSGTQHLPERAAAAKADVDVALTALLEAPATDWETEVLAGVCKALGIRFTERSTGKLAGQMDLLCSLVMAETVLRLQDPTRNGKPMPLARRDLKAVARQGYPPVSWPNKLLCSFLGEIAKIVEAGSIPRRGVYEARRRISLR